MQPDRRRGLGLQYRTNIFPINTSNSPFNATRLSSFVPILGPTQMQRLLRPTIVETPPSPPIQRPFHIDTTENSSGAQSPRSREELLEIMQSIVGSSTSVEELTNILLGAGDDIQIALNHWAQRWLTCQFYRSQRLWRQQPTSTSISFWTQLSRQLFFHHCFIYILIKMMILTVYEDKSREVALVLHHPLSRKYRR